MKKVVSIFSKCFWLVSGLLLFCNACSVSKKINKQVVQVLLQDSVLATGQIGISIYEPATKQYWYNYNADKYFVPASNVKLFTCYAAMQHIGDSLTGLWYQPFNDTAINIIPSGDPTFMHPAFAKQPVINFLQQSKKTLLVSNQNNVAPLGKGWSWDDYNETFMAERNTWPIYGNVVDITLQGFKNTNAYTAVPDFNISPSYFKDKIDSLFVLPTSLLKNSVLQADSVNSNESQFNIIRQKDANHFTLKYNEEQTAFTNAQIPFCVHNNAVTIDILNTNFALAIKQGQLNDGDLYPGKPPQVQWHTIKTQPTHNALQHMMYYSDNFIAEQVLVMLQQQSFWQLQPLKNTEEVIAYIIQNNLKDVPQPPIWVDGSGLSRYNLFTPQSFVYIINKMNNEFGIDKVKSILTTSGQGTLKNYYVQDSTFIYAKTGTLSGVVALSGFVITKKKKLLIFSILTNNFVGKARLVRRSIEKFITNLIQQN